MKRVDSRTILTACLAAVAVMVAAPGLCGASRLQAVSFSADQGVTSVKLQADSPVRFSDFSLSDPDRIVVDCWDTDGAVSAPQISGDLVKDVSFVRMAGEHGTTTRMILSLARPSEYTILQKQSALEVTIQPSDEKSAAGMVEAGSGVRGARISLDVQGADVKTVLRTLAEMSGRNIIPSKEVKGEVSMALKNVPWRDALNALCKSQTLGYKEEEGIIRVGPLDMIQNEELNQRTAERRNDDLLPLETRVVHVSFANVNELKDPIASTLSKRGHVECDPRTSSLMVTDIAEKAEEAEKLARQLDARTPQITITAKLVDVDEGSEMDLGISWGATGTSGTVQATGAQDLNGNPGPIVHAPLTDQSDGAGGYTHSPPLDLHIGTIAPDGSGFNAKLQALASANKANIISNPTITTVDNREARILVGQKIPLITADAAGNAVTQLTTIGISLKVTPHLNSDNKITMDIHPEVSDLASGATVQGGVIINTAEADTRVMVDDGETAVIGGLIRTNEVKSEQGVPFLKDIPVLGNLFKTTSTQSQKRNLMILITPHLVSGTPGK
jgi:type IV pilus assembly protein PilQ